MRLAAPTIMDGVLRAAAEAAESAAITLPQAYADVLPALRDADHVRRFTASADPIVNGAAFRAPDGCPLGVRIYRRVCRHGVPVRLPCDLLYVPAAALDVAQRATPWDPLALARPPADGGRPRPVGAHPGWYVCAEAGDILEVGVVTRVQAACTRLPVALTVREVRAAAAAVAPVQLASSVVVDGRCLGEVHYLGDAAAAALPVLPLGATQTETTFRGLRVDDDGAGAAATAGAASAGGGDGDDDGRADVPPAVGYRQIRVAGIGVLDRKEGASGGGGAVRLSQRVRGHTSRPPLDGGSGAGVSSSSGSGAARGSPRGDGADGHRPGHPVGASGPADDALAPLPLTPIGQVRLQTALAVHRRAPVQPPRLGIFKKRVVPKVAREVPLCAVGGGMVRPDGRAAAVDALRPPLPPPAARSADGRRRRGGRRGHAWTRRSASSAAPALGLAPQAVVFRDDLPGWGLTVAYRPPSFFHAAGFLDQDHRRVVFATRAVLGLTAIGAGGDGDGEAPEVDDDDLELVGMTFSTAATRREQSQAFLNTLHAQQFPSLGGGGHLGDAKMRLQMEGGWPVKGGKGGGRTC